MSSAPEQSLQTILAELNNLKMANILSGEEFSSLTGAFNKILDRVKEDQVKAKSRIFVEAKYEFNGTEATDLSLKPGMRIEVLEKLNADWWRGQAVDSGAIGIFPANYIEVVESKSSHIVTDSNSEKVAIKKTSYYGKMSSANPKPFDPKTEYTPPPNYELHTFKNYQPPAQQPVQQPAEQPASQTVQYQQEYQQPVIVEQQPQRRYHPVLHRFGEAAIFGAGAAVGADLVNSIL